MKQHWFVVAAAVVFGGCAGEADAPPQDEVTARSSYGPLAFARVDATGRLVAQMNSALPVPSAPTDPIPTTVLSTSVGTYFISFNGFAATSGDGTGGNVQVTAEGASNVRCRLVSWSGTTSIRAQVRCSAPSGEPANSPFAILFYRYRMPTPSAGPTYQAYSLVSAAGVVDPLRDYNNSGNHNVVTKTATGRYRVTIPNRATASGSMAVTPVGEDAVCSVRDWATGYVDVDCVDRNGMFVDRAFSFSFSHGSLPLAHQGAYAAFRDGQFVPGTARAQGFIIGCSSATIMAMRWGSLATLTVDGDLGSFTDEPFVRVNLTNGLGTGVYCKVEGQSAPESQPPSAANASVRCYAPNGAIVPSPAFTYTHVTSDAAGPC